MKIEFKLLDATASMGQIRARTNLNTVLAVVAVVLSIVAILV